MRGSKAIYMPLFVVFSIIILFALAAAIYLEPSESVLEYVGMPALKIKVINEEIENVKFYLDQSLLLSEKQAVYYLISNAGYADNCEKSGSQDITKDVILLNNCPELALQKNFIKITSSFLENYKENYISAHAAMGNKKTLAIIPSLDKDSTLETLKNIVLIPYNGLSDVKLLKLSTTSDRINYNFSSLTISTPELANVTSGNIIISHKKQDLTFLKEFYAKLYSTLSVCNQLSLDQCSTKLSQEIPNIRVIKQNNLLLIITKLKDTELKLLVNPTAPLPLLDLDMNSAQDYVLNGEKLVPQESDETLNKMRESLQKVYLLKPRM